MTPAHLLRAFPSLVRVAVAQHVAYRAEMTIWILTATLPLIMLALWNAVASQGPVAGFGQAEVARYFVATLIVRQLTGAWVVWELSYSIRTGQLSPMLLRPFNPLVQHAVVIFTAVPFRLAILAPIVAALVAWRPDLLVFPGAAEVALFVPALLLAWLLNFLIQCAFGLLAFWLDKTDGLFNVWQTVSWLLSGYLAPLAFFPEGWASVLRWLPFAASLAVPIELLGGFVTAREALWQVAVQAGWVAVFGALTAWIWRSGVRRYGAFGA